MSLPTRRVLTAQSVRPGARDDARTDVAAGVRAMATYLLLAPVVGAV